MNNLEYTLAKRTAQHDGESRTAVMMRIATISVALALAVMIVTLAVFNGFRREIYADLRGFGADIQLMEVSGLRRDARPIEYEPLLKERVAALDGVKSVAPYIVMGGMAKSGEQTLGLQLKGIDATYDVEWWQSRMVEGQMPAVAAEERTKQILLSRTTAERLAVGVGDKIEILYVSAISGARRDSYKVSGLYHTGLEEMDAALYPMIDSLSMKYWIVFLLSCCITGTYPRSIFSLMRYKMWSIGKSLPVAWQTLTTPFI